MEAFWVFGYGSLMWKPGFNYQQAKRAHAVGYHRALCIYSHHHRGTKDRPGLVMGLNPGGTCCGMAFYVDKQHASEAYDYLVDREQVDGTYREEQISLQFEDNSNVTALVFATKMDHAQFAGNLSAKFIAEIVDSATGVAGPNRAYVTNTVSALRQMNIHDGKLEEVLEYLPNARDEDLIIKKSA